MSLDGVVDGASVVVCCGPGGVGKTTTAAVIGRWAADRGRRVVVVTIDPARRLADALGLAGGLTGEPTRVDADRTGPGEFWAMMLDAPAMFERVVRAHAADPAQADRIVRNRFFLNIAGNLSGTQEYMASEALHELAGDPRFDLVVVDTPPSRNALDFLEAPGVLTRFLDHPVFKLMMMPTRTGLRIVSLATQPMLRAIGGVVGSDVLSDTVAFFQAFAGMDAGFRARAAAVDALLREPGTRFVLVTAPQRRTIDEAAWLAGRLDSLGIGVAATVANRVHPRFGDGSVADAERRAAAATARGADDAAALWSNLAAERRLADAQREALDPLVRSTTGPLVEVPLLEDDVHDLDGLGRIERHLFVPTS